ncbi:MAG: hypothetical protein ACR2H4_12825 [Pyrinomonadaceae bacterium]
MGSSVVTDSSLVGDIDVIGLTDGVDSPLSEDKRVFRLHGEPDLEFTPFPLSFPELLAKDDRLHFLLFRERKKLEQSVCLFGEAEAHRKLLSSVCSIPLPKETILKFTKILDLEIRGISRTGGQSSVNAFYLLATLLGYSHFRSGPVKPKWMFRELRGCGCFEAEACARMLVEPLHVHGLSNVLAVLDTTGPFLDYWGTKGTAWKDAKASFRHDKDASALTTLYCMHGYATRAMASDSRDVFEPYSQVIGRLSKDSDQVSKLLGNSLEKLLLRLQ